MVSVLIVEDSPSMALLLQEIFRQAGLYVAGTAHDGKEAVALTERLRPDVITMDVRMPGMDGIEATRLIMERVPTPIVVVSAALDDPELHISFRAFAYGAVAVVEKPPSPNHAGFAAASRQLIETVRAMAGVRVIRRRQNGSPPATPPAAEAPAPAVPQAPPASPLSATPPARKPGPAPKLLAIAASTGGPQALAVLLGGLPDTFRLPIVVVQHISPGFVGGLTEWLTGCCRLRCSVARDGQPLLPGHVMFAPDNVHLEVDTEGPLLVATLSSRPPVVRHRPSATPLFDSVARTCGARAIGLVMTGMGCDGTDGLRHMHERGALTLAQSPGDCVVPNMPQAAVDAGVVDEVLPLAQLPGRLVAAQTALQES